MNQKEKSNQTILNIIDAGINEFAEKGNLVSLNAICKNYNISKGKLYHHFSSKDELLCACVCYSLNNLTNNINSFDVDKNLDIKENFHNYYMDRIRHWKESPNELKSLRLAYTLKGAVLSAESLEQIAVYINKWRDAKRNKILQLFNETSCKLRTDSEITTSVLLLMYENTFQVLEDRMLTAVINDDTILVEKIAKELIEYHDSIIDMILYGVIEK